MKYSEEAAKAKVYSYLVSSLYSALGEDHHEKIAVIDEIMAECIDDLMDEETSGELAEQQMQLLRVAVRETLGSYAISVAAAARDELKQRSKHREGLAPAYTEVDL